MRRRLLGLVVLAALAACSDSSPTGSRTPPGLDHVRSTITPTGSLDENIIALIAFWPTGQTTGLTSQWNAIKAKVASGQLSVAKQMLFQTIKYIQNKTPNMGDPGNPDTRNSAASRLIYYMVLYVYGGADTPTPPYNPGADDAVGLLTPSSPLTVVTPSKHAGAQFDAGSVGENRVIVIRENTTEYPTTCTGPLAPVVDCQYPLFYFIESFPDGKLLKIAKAAVCHVNDGGSRDPTSDGVHIRVRLAHRLPSDPADYTPGATQIFGEGEGVEVLPFITQTFVICPEGEVSYAPSDIIIGSVFQRGARLASMLGSKVARLLLPRSAYAIDQGGGGGFEAFSPFNVVDPGPSAPPPAPPPSF